MISYLHIVTVRMCETYLQEEDVLFNTSILSYTTVLLSGGVVGSEEASDCLDSIWEV